jgi:hypothetical protein
VENSSSYLGSVRRCHIVFLLGVRGVCMNFSSEVADWLLYFYGGVALILWVML